MSAYTSTPFKKSLKKDILNLHPRANRISIDHRLTID